MTTLDKVAVSIIIFLFTLISGVVFWGSNLPVSVSCVAPADCSLISPRGAMVFEFSRPVEITRLPSVWQISPNTAGQWVKIDNRRVRWISTEPIPLTKNVTFGFIPGSVGEDNESIRSETSWTAEIRSTEILAISATGNETELFLLDPEGKQDPVQFSHTGGKTFDYDVDPTGNIVIFTVVNDRLGSDIWKIDRDGNNQELLLDCGGDRCTAPVWAPTMAEIAYTREVSDPKKNGALGAPRVWMLDPESGITSPLFEDSQQIGYGTSWASDGLWMSIWDGMSGGVKVVNRQTGENFIVQSSSGNSGCWSRDNKHLIFSNTIVRGSGYHNVILSVNVDDKSMETVVGENSETGGTSYDNPLCNPINDILAMTIQPNVLIPGRSLVVYDPATRNQSMIISDLSLIPGQYSWNAYGDSLVFQVDRLSSNQGNTQILLWENGNIRSIADGFRFPKWLP